MTQTILTNTQNDIYIAPSGSLALGSGQLAVENICENVSKLQLGEALLQTGLGIPNFQAVWVGVPNIATFQQYLRKALGNAGGVRKVVSLTTSVLNGQLKYIAKIESAYGLLAISGQVPING